MYNLVRPFMFGLVKNLVNRQKNLFVKNLVNRPNTVLHLLMVEIEKTVQQIDQYSERFPSFMFHILGK